MIEILALDADDTLWHNEIIYIRAKQHFCDLLAAYQPAEKILAALDQTELRNLEFYGYGIKGFTLSMIETALAVTGGAVTVGELSQVMGIGRGMLSAPVELMDGVAETLPRLAARWPLMLITKGDVFDQWRKLEHSGLAGHFRYIEIVPDKTTRHYQAVFTKYGIDLRRAVMAGNSLRSDIYPFLELGGRAVYIPYENTWSHENQAPENSSHRYEQVEKFSDLPNLLERMVSCW